VDSTTRGNKSDSNKLFIPLDQFYFQFWQFQFGSEYQGALAIKHRASDQNYSMLHFKEVIPLTESVSNIDIPHFP
jgi:hypothetical protein